MKARVRRCVDGSISGEVLKRKFRGIPEIQKCRFRESLTSSFKPGFFEAAPAKIVAEMKFQLR